MPSTEIQISNVRRVKENSLLIPRDSLNLFREETLGEAVELYERPQLQISDSSLESTDLSSCGEFFSLSEEKALWRFPHFQISGRWESRGWKIDRKESTLKKLSERKLTLTLRQRTENQPSNVNSNPHACKKTNPFRTGISYLSSISSLFNDQPQSLLQQKLSLSTTRRTVLNVVKELNELEHMEGTERIESMKNLRARRNSL